MSENEEIHSSQEVNLDTEECFDTPANGNVERLESVIEMRDVHKSYETNDGKSLKVLEGFTLNIQDIKNYAQKVAILGPSGSGKTTALRIMAGLEQPSSGQVLVTNTKRGKNHAMVPVEAGQVGVVFQKYPLFNNMTVMDNLVFPAVMRGMQRQHATDKANLYLQEFKMVQHAGAWPAQLSGGQRQRVAILQQLMIEGRHFIIMDEPFSGLDTENVMAVQRLIDKVSRLHTLNTFIIITHDVTNALIVADQVHLIGREYDENRNAISGAKVMHTYDLLEENLAYQPHIEDRPRFAEIRKEIKYGIMPTL